MAARETQEMKEAKQLVLSGLMTPNAAATSVGLHRSAIYMAPWYRDWKRQGRPLTATPQGAK